LSLAGTKWKSRMKLLSTFLAACALGAPAQTSVTTVITKSEGCVAYAFLQFSPDGGELARACGFAPIQLFDTATYNKCRTFRSEIDYTPRLMGFDYSPDGKTMATAQNDGGALIWKADDPGKPVPPNGKPLKPFFGVDEVYALDKPLHVLQPPNAPGDDFASVLSISYSPDGKLILTRHQSGHLKIWNASTWALQSDLTVSEKGNKALFSALAIAPDSKSFVIADMDGLLHLWSLDRKSEIRAIRSPDGAGRPPLDLAFSPDGKTLAVVYVGQRFFDGPVVLWNTADWTAQTMSGYEVAAFSRDGKLLALGRRDDVRLLDLASRTELRFIDIPALKTQVEVFGPNNSPHPGEKVPCGVSGLAFSPDGATLAVNCSEGSLRIVKLRP